MKRKSYLFQFVEWLAPYLTDNVVGWLYAANALIAFTSAAFFWKMQIDGAGLAMGCGVFFLLVAVAFWTPEEWKD